MNEKQTAAPPSGVQAASAMPHNMSQRCWTAGCQRGRASLGTFGYCSKVCADVAAAPPVAPAPAREGAQTTLSADEQIQAVMREVFDYAKVMDGFSALEGDERANRKDAAYAADKRIRDAIRAMLSAAAPADQPSDKE